MLSSIFIYFLRGLLYKIFSLVAKQCKEDNFLIPYQDKNGNVNVVELKIALWRFLFWFRLFKS